MNKLILIPILVSMVGCDSATLDVILSDDSSDSQSDGIAPPSDEQSVQDDVVAQDEEQELEVPACDPVAAPIGGGSGIEADPYLICSYAQFLQLGQNPYRTAYSRLESDIAFSGTHVPLSQYFGHLDGNDHALTGVVITATNGGIFRSLAGHIKNLRIIAPEATVGVIGLDMIGIASMTHVDVIGGLVRSNQHVGGFFQESWGRIDDCTSTADVETTGVGKYAGGIVAFIQWSTGNDSYVLRTNADGQVRITTGGTAGRIAGSIVGGNRLKDCDQARLQTSVAAMAPFGYNAGAASNCQ